MRTVLGTLFLDLVLSKGLGVLGSGFANPTPRAMTPEEKSHMIVVESSFQGWTYQNPIVIGEADGNATRTLNPEPRILLKPQPPFNGLDGFKYLAHRRACQIEVDLAGSRRSED